MDRLTAEKTNAKKLGRVWRDRSRYKDTALSTRLALEAVLSTVCIQCFVDNVLAKTTRCRVGVASCLDQVFAGTPHGFEPQVHPRNWTPVATASPKRSLRAINPAAFATSRHAIYTGASLLARPTSVAQRGASRPHCFTLVLLPELYRQRPAWGNFGAKDDGLGSASPPCPSLDIGSGIDLPLQQASSTTSGHWPVRSLFGVQEIQRPRC
ncbi:hypothetical protein BD289DRAFT_170393 [Coniella lustricola]|uniref:Uncharacterized protein n=1 Tax=Coniella lustricola TaxID=2025994 RepID=A0A2T3AE40_9PEZI|nr:hypothetical protein BD289DRAFT_170393 [Coniella lustricola]